MRSTVFGLLLSPALFFYGNAAIAQQSPKPVTAVPQHSEDLSAATQASKGGTPQASPEIQSLTTALSGEWSLSVKWEPEASMPNGLVNAGEESWRAGPGGYTLLEEEHLRSPQGDLLLLGVVWWDSTMKKLQGMECQNLLPYTCDVKGALNDITMSWDGKQFVIDEMETSKTGKKSMWHEVWSEITPTSFTQTGEYGEPGGPRKRLFTIHATRVTTQGKNDAQGAESAKSSAPAVAVDTTAIAETIKMDVAQLVAGINAHDAVKATAYDAPNIISMECGRPSTIGVEADREGFSMGFAHNPDWKVSLIDESVDVASGGDMAVYRGTYNEDSSKAGVPMTHKTNFIAEFKRQSDGQWRIVWYSVSNMERSHPK
jgi:ketosteroid isomerase-like protein